MHRRLRLHSQTVPRTKHAVNLAARASAGLPIGAVAAPLAAADPTNYQAPTTVLTKWRSLFGVPVAPGGVSATRRLLQLPGSPTKNIPFQPPQKWLDGLTKRVCPCSLLAAESAIPHLCRFSPRARVGIDYDDDYVSQRQLFLCRMPLLQKKTKLAETPLHPRMPFCRHHPSLRSLDCGALGQLRSQATCLCVPSSLSRPRRRNHRGLRRIHTGQSVETGCTSNSQELSADMMARRSWRRVRRSCRLLGETRKR